MSTFHHISLTIRSGIPQWCTLYQGEQVITKNLKHSAHMAPVKAWVLEVVRSLTAYQESSGSTSAIWLGVVRCTLLKFQGSHTLYTYKTKFRLKKGLYMGNLNLSAARVKTRNISSRMIRLTDRTIIMRNKFHISAYLLRQILPSDLWHQRAVAQLLLFHF
jgi:hypothetical protein